MMKPRSSYSKTAFILLFSVFLVAAVTKAKSSLPDITLEQAKEINADNTVIFLFRHGERCDRSDMPCYSDHCLSFLARDRLGKKFKPAYLDALIMHYDGTRLILDGKYNKEA